MSIDHLSLRARLLLTVLLPVLLLAVAMTGVSLSRGARRRLNPPCLQA